MRTSRIIAGVAGLVWLVVAGQSQGLVTPYVNNLGGNSGDWTIGAAAAGGLVHTLDWEAHPTGALNGSFYSGSDGVTISNSNGFYSVGPYFAPSGTVSGPTSSGEGLSNGSNALIDADDDSTVVFDFAQPVGSFGLKTVDLYNPGGVHPYTMTFYTGSGGTGSVLATMTTPGYCFQLNYVYFFGGVSDAFDIKSVIITDTHTAVTGDSVGFDDIRFTTAVPEPMGLSAVLLSGAVIALRRDRRRF